MSNSGAPRFFLGSGFWVLGSGFWVLGSGFWVLGSGFWVLGSGFWVLGSGFWVLGSGFWYMLLVNFAFLEGVNLKSCSSCTSMFFSITIRITRIFPSSFFLLPLIPGFWVPLAKLAKKRKGGTTKGVKCSKHFRNYLQPSSFKFRRSPIPSLQYSITPPFLSTLSPFLFPLGA